MPVCQSCNSSMIIAEFAKRFLQNGTRASPSGINPPLHPMRHDAMEDFEATTIATHNLRLIRDRTRSRDGSLLGSSKPGCLHVHSRTAYLSRRDGDLRTKAHLLHTAR